MEIIKSSKEFNKRELYKLTKGDTESIQNAAGLVINLDCFIEYADVNQKGEEVEILAIMDKSGTVYSTISQTFKQRFYEIIDIFGTGEELPGIMVTEGRSKAGRSYMSCTIE